MELTIEFLLMFPIMLGFLIMIDTYLYHNINDGLIGYIDSWKDDFRKLVS